MADGAQTPSPAAGIMTQEMLRTVAEAIGAALAKQPSADASQGDAPAPVSVGVSAAPVVPLTSTQAGQGLGDVLAPLAAPVLAKAANKFKCPTLWVAIGTIAGLFAQNPLGLQLHPATQVAAAAVAAVYVAAQAIADNSTAGGSSGKA